jgi:hypothetical protein
MIGLPSSSRFGRLCSSSTCTPDLNNPVALLLLIRQPFAAEGIVAVAVALNVTVEVMEVRSKYLFFGVIDSASPEA